MGVPDMADITAAEPLLARVESYLAGAFHPIPEEQVVAKAIQSSCSWIFALLRNAFICGVLQYLADASEKRDAADIGDRSLGCARGLLLLVHQYVGADSISLREAQATRSFSRRTDNARRVPVALVRGLCGNAVRHP
jgi:hypothetical protein